QSEVDAKLTNVVTTNITQSETGAKTFNANVTATGFGKAGKDDTSVLLAGGGDSITYRTSLLLLILKGYKTSYQLKVRQLCCLSKARQLCRLFLDYKMSNIYIDEALLDAVGLSEFPELYAYIHEREPKPIIDGIANQVIIGPQQLQDQVKDNDDTGW
ncbi:MAG: hypothetical protein EZS28_052844, partial [Streblomastix strix]